MSVTKKYFLAVDLGGTSTKVAVIDSDGNILSFDSFLTNDFSDVLIWCEKILEISRILTQKSGIGHNKLIGCGVGVPGLVNFEEGLIYNLTNVPGWKNVRLRDVLKKKLAIPVFVDNDVNIAALGEYKFGGHKSTNIVFVALGTGVGGGLVIDGKIYRGNSFSAGELGHIVIDDAGLKCNCGSKGCIETYVGNNYIVRNVIRRLKKNKKSMLTKMCGGDYKSLTPKMIFDAAKRGDRFSKEIWGEVGYNLGRMLVKVVNLLNPDLIVVGGGVSGAFGVFGKTLGDTVKQYSLPTPAKHVKVVRSRLKNNAGLLGVVALFEH